MQGTASCHVKTVSSFKGGPSRKDEVVPRRRGMGSKDYYVLQSRRTAGHLQAEVEKQADAKGVLTFLYRFSFSSPNLVFLIMVDIIVHIMVR